MTTDAEERVSWAYYLLMNDAIRRGLTTALEWSSEEQRQAWAMEEQAATEQSDSGAPKRQCQQCYSTKVVVKAAAICKSGWVAHCAECGYRWEVRRSKAAEEAAGRRQRIASVIHKTGRSAGQQLWRYDRRT